MAESEYPTGRIRFGVFEVDFRAGELRKQGLKVRLQNQPFQVLAMLLERPHEVITREELQKVLWPSDTVGDFDQASTKQSIKSVTRWAIQRRVRAFLRR